MKNRLVLGAGTLGLMVMLSGCVTGFGSNMKGSFVCSAPDGICAPSGVIDDRALALISGDEGDRMIEKQIASGPRTTFGFDAGAQGRTGEKVLKIVFPSYIDNLGRLHEATAIHTVVNAGGWREEAGSPIAGNSASVRLEADTNNLLTAVTNPPVDPDMPSPEAIAAARAKSATSTQEIKDQVASTLVKGAGKEKPTAKPVIRAGSFPASGVQ